MNEASRWRIERALRLASFYAAHPRVLMVAIGGSAARGEAWSDIDLSVAWDGDPDRDWLETPRLAIEGNRFTWMNVAAAGPGIWLEQYFLKQLDW